MSEQRIGIVIQARTGSTRLPVKMLLPFYEQKTILTLIIERLKSSFDIPIILATTISEKDSQLALLADELDVYCVRGSEENVLSRFLLAAETLELTHLVRVCADNPFLDMQLLGELLESDYTDYDYVSHRLGDGTPAIKTHFGFFAELVSRATLEKINDETQEKLYQEHVTNFIYSHENKFKINFLELPSSFDKYQGKVRLTIDTKEDFHTASLLHTKLMNDNSTFGYENIFSLIEGNDNLIETMVSQIEHNTK